MGKRGPPKKVAAANKLAGNPGKRARSPVDRGVIACPDWIGCPDWLPLAAKTEWARTLPLLKEPLQPRDVASLACYCQSVADLQWASAELEAKGRVVTNTNGTIGPHPAVKLAAGAMARIKQFAGEFGFTPAARSRVPDPPGIEKDEVEEFLDG